MLPRMLALSLLLLAPAAVRAQAPPGKPSAPAAAPATPAKVQEFLVTTPGNGPYYARLLPSPDAPKRDFDPQGPFNGRSLTVKLDLAQLGKTPRIAIDDTKSGNTAIVPVNASKMNADLKSLDFDHVRKVQVLVTYEGKPLQAARVTLTPSDGPASTVVVDPSAQGTAVFYDVPTGKAKLAIKYGDNLNETSDVQITGEHPAGALQIAAPVKNPAPTLDVAAPAPGAPAPATAPAGAKQQPLAPSTGTPLAPPQPSPQSGLVSLLGGLLGIAVVVGIGVLIYRWYLSGGLAATLKKAGIETSGPQAADDGKPAPWQPNAPAPPVVADPTICPFCGQRKDAAGNCACTVTPGAPAPSAPVAAPAQPRLVASIGAYAGSIFPIPGSACTIGRDPSSDIPLANDATVSRRHASIQCENGAWSVTDLGSSNGVFVNGVRIGGAQPLHPGDEVQIGNTRFRFEA